MAVDLFAAVNRSKVDKLPFLKKGAYPFGYVDSKEHVRLGIVYEVDADSFLKIQKLLAGKEERTLVKGDRVFVLSGCKVPQFKIKEFLRSIGAVMVSNIEDATVFVGNYKITQQFDNGYNPEQLNSLSMLIDTVYTEVSGVKDENLMIDEVVNDYYPDIDEMAGQARFNKRATGYSANYKFSGSVRYMKCIVPYVATIVYEILSKKIVTINDECLYKQIPGAVKLDKETTQSLMAMMESPDIENQKTAHEILANCDYEGQDLCLYTIARGHYHQISTSRYKNVRLFVEKTKLYDLYSTSEETYLKKLADENKLTKDALDLLLPLVAKKVELRINHINSSVFSIRMELRPEYANLLGDHKFNKEVKPDNNTEIDEF